MDEDVRFLLSQIAMRKMAIKSKLNLLSYFLREDKSVNSRDVDRLTVGRIRQIEQIGK